MFKLAHTSTVAAYYTEFFVLANRVEGLSYDVIVYYFVSGLKLELRKAILAQEPMTLHRAANLAKLFDDCGSPVSLGGRSSQRSWISVAPAPLPLSKVPSTSIRFAVSTPVASHSVGSSSTLLPTTIPAYKQFSPAELRAKWEKGLCYYCDDKYSPRHKCKATFSLLMGKRNSLRYYKGMKPSRRLWWKNHQQI